MTLHVATTGPNFGILLSDSQGSTDTSLFHGWQKQVVGDEFLLGVAGSGLALDAILAAVHERGPGTAVEIEKFVRDFCESDLTLATREAVQLVLVGHGTPPYVRNFIPGALRNWCAKTTFSSLGSGAEFVSAAVGRDEALGLLVHPQNLADGLLWAYEYASTSRTSLTVDDQYLVSFLLNGRSYMFGHENVNVENVAPKLQQQWNEASRRFDKLIAICDAIRGENLTVHRTALNAHAGRWSQTDHDVCAVASAAIAVNRGELVATVFEFCQWYEHNVR